MGYFLMDMEFKNKEITMNLKKLKCGTISFSYTLPEEDLKIAKTYGMRGKVFRGNIYVDKAYLNKNWTKVDPESVVIRIRDVGYNFCRSPFHTYKPTKLPKMEGATRDERILALCEVKIRKHFRFLEAMRKRRKVTDKRYSIQSKILREKKKQAKLLEEQNPITTFFESMRYSDFTKAEKYAPRLKGKLDRSELSKEYSSTIVLENGKYGLSITCLKTEKQRIKDLLSYERQLIREEEYQAFKESWVNYNPNYVQQYIK